MTEAMDSLSCPICLEHLKWPVTTACGHSYCLDCIEGCWNLDKAKGVYKCPQCRQTFFPRPVLKKNIMLNDLVEKLKRTALQMSLPAHSYTGLGDVECDVCTGRRFKAVTTCLECQESYCNTHLQSHCQTADFKKHQLVAILTQTQDKSCSLHNKRLDVFCQTDRQWICCLCVMDEHKGHESAEAKTLKVDDLLEKQLKQRRSFYQQQIQEKEKKLIELKQSVTFIKHVIQAAVEDSEKIFTEMFCSMAKRRREVKEMIRAEEKCELSHVKEHLERLEQEISELRRGNELEQRLHTEDPRSFLQSLGGPADPTTPCSSLVSSSLGFDDLKRKITELMKTMDHICQEEVEKMAPSADTEKWWSVNQLVTLNLTDNQGFGFRIVGGDDTSDKIQITTILRDSAADRDGRLQSGDQLVSVDNVSVNRKTHEDVVALMRKAGHNRHVTLMVRRVQKDITNVLCRPLKETPTNSPGHT
ncbi:hypothetical protein DPEC_G00081500 [Dallia pectoralis]|uniref:Uncharacterized protein n=1 Tax=Dallia pectoralis TaxID=75939 RepID=A0ACC2GZ45_DALPE|nr:hypothetical protein DPEC_G00081500 [Dallia pectoralis]